LIAVVCVRCGMGKQHEKGTLHGVIWAVTQGAFVPSAALIFIFSTPTLLKESLLRNFNCYFLVIVYYDWLIILTLFGSKRTELTYTPRHAM
jgi:hypothetical protein